MHLLLVLFLARKLLDPLFDPIQLGGQVVIGEQVLFQCLLMDAVELQTAKPIQMSLCPVTLGTVVLIPVPQTERKDLLLDLFQCQLMIVPHPNELLDLFIFLCGNVNFTVIIVSQTACDQSCVPFVRLDPFLAGGNRHRRWGKNHTLHIVRSQFPLQRITQTPSFITAYEQRIVTVVEAHSLQVIQHLAVMSFHLLGVLCLFFFVCVAAERKIFFMYVHSYVNCAIIHFSDLHLYAVIPVTLISSNQ